MREWLRKYVTARSLQLALREMQADYTTPRTYAFGAAIVCILGLSGPFGTYASLAPLPRFAYWAGVFSLTHLVANFCATWMRAALQNRGWKRNWRIAPIGMVAGLAAATTAMGVNDLVFHPVNGVRAHLFAAVVYGMPIGIAIALMIVLSRGIKQSGDDAPPQPSRLLKRLPVDKRGQLISMSVSDHYVEVTTSRGKIMVLMRLRDALDEVGERGIQVHRSHWVAFDAIKAVHRANGRVEIETNLGDKLPVSRSFLPELRRAGLIT